MCTSTSASRRGASAGACGRTCFWSSDWCSWCRGAACGVVGHATTGRPRRSARRSVESSRRVGELERLEALLLPLKKQHDRNEPARKKWVSCRGVRVGAHAFESIQGGQFRLIWQVLFCWSFSVILGILLWIKRTEDGTRSYASHGPPERRIGPWV